MVGSNREITLCGLRLLLLKVTKVTIISKAIILKVTKVTIISKAIILKVTKVTIIS